MAWLRGFGADETKAAFARARELAEAAGQISERAASYYGVWVGQLVRAELSAARERSEAFVAEMRPGGASALLATAHRCVGMTAWLQGDYGPSREHLEVALEMSDETRDREGRKIFGQDTSVIATSYLAHNMWLTGHVERARELVAQQLRTAEASQHLPTQVNAIDQAAILAVATGDHAAARPLAVRMGQLSEGPGLTLYSTSAVLIEAWCDGRDYGAAGVIERMRKAIAAYIAPGSEILHPLYTGLLAEFEADGPAPDDALSTIAEAMAYSRTSGENWTDPVAAPHSRRHPPEAGRSRGGRARLYDRDRRRPRAEVAAVSGCRRRCGSPGCTAVLGRARLANISSAALEVFPAAAEWTEIEDARALIEALSRAA